MIGFDSTPQPAGRIVFVGAVHEARPALRVLLASPLVTTVAVITATTDGLDRLAGAVDLAGQADRAGVPVIRTEDVNAPEIVNTVRELAPDLLVVVGWTRLLGRSLLSVPRRGCVGFHASLLPAHRGRAPVNWAILRGETVTGNTMMMLDPGADTGDIVDQRPVAIGPEDDCGTVYQRVGEAGASMLAAHLPALLDGTAPRLRQNPNDGDVLPKRTPEMGVIDWTLPAHAVHDWVRALTLPYPGAFGAIDGRQVMVWTTLPPLPHRGRPEAPGTVLDVELPGVSVATGLGSVVVTRMSAPGEEPEPAAQWCRRHGIRPGMRFDRVDAELARWSRGEGPRPKAVAR
ncbi:MAG TPA: methionyl-tRNA formyltransferase [Pseudonocardiaceae bacterium]|nr:methionyl-tRNA formyltransferase [Pseudonocardiaceae bacterium]